ncbi:Protein involved in inorganic phosphate transport [Globisporangium polare]
MAAKQSPMRMVIMLPLMFLMGKVDFENDLILNSARAAFLLAQVTSLLLGLYIKKQVEAKNDQRKIYVPGVKSPFDPSPNYDEVTETTYAMHELAKVNEFIKQTCIGAGISSFIHFKMGVNHVVLIQAIMTPMNLYDNQLVQAYVFGKRNGRMWGERLEGETNEEAAAANGIAPVAATDAVEVTKTKETKTDLTPEEAILKVSGAGADADFDELWAAVKSAVNASTKEDQWTALMVACGSPIDTTEFIEKVVEAGADVTAVDGDGWTALHWSAYHGRPEAAETLLEAIPEKKLAQLLAIKALDGRTAKEVAKAEDNSDVVDVIAKFADLAAAGASEVEPELRQRKPVTSVEDVD